MHAFRFPFVGRVVPTQHKKTSTIRLLLAIVVVSFFMAQHKARAQEQSDIAVVDSKAAMTSDYVREDTSLAEHAYCTTNEGGYRYLVDQSACASCVSYWKPLARDYCAKRGGLFCYSCTENCDTEGPFRGILFSCGEDAR